MKATCFLMALALTALVSAAGAQTNTFPASGNVGIGTTTPLYKLDVNGQANVLSGTFPPIHVTRSISSGGSLYGTALLELTSTVPTAGNGAAFYFKGPNSSGSSTFAGLIGGGLSTITSGSEIGYIGFKAAYNGGDPGNGSYGLKLVATSSNVDNALFSGNVGIGTTSPQYALDVNGQMHAAGGIVFPNGVQTEAYTGTTCGGDYAESVDVTGDRKHYEPGDLLVIDPDAPGKFLKSAEPYSTLVAGIYSTKPGTVGRRQLTPKSPEEVPMAMMGIVPTKVTAENGAIKTGDLLVSSSKVGYAMKGTARSKLTGAVIGKALGSLDSGTGTIEVLVTLQ